MMETDFSKVVEHIRTNPTLVIITGMPGCGKTTMAMRLMKEINGCSDMGAYLTTTNEISDSDAYNIYVLDDVVSIPKNAREVLDMGKSLIIVTSSFAYVPQCYRRVGDDLKHLCRISFRCYQRGIFDVSGLDMDDISQTTHYSFSGKITEKDIEQVEDIIDEWIQIKTSELDSRFR